MIKALIVAVATALFVIAMAVLPRFIAQSRIAYDCRALHGGWHPDVPIEVQKQCRARS